VWNENIDPQAGVLRLVFGLGTRAVERSDDDYTRVVALNAPLRRPEANFDEVTEYAQHRVDVIDIEANRFESLHSEAVFNASPGLPVEMFATRQRASGGDAPDRRGALALPWVLTFQRLLSETSFVQDMRDMLRVLHRAYDYPVDIEYTANFLADGSCRINLVQCRPLQVREGGGIVPPPPGLQPADVVFEAIGTIVGQSSFATVDRLIYVAPAAYAELPLRDRFAIARLIGHLTHLDEDRTRPKTLMLLGPGRWGTSTPSLGVPVSFAEINTVSVLCEIVSAGTNVVPDVSLGTHFFNDLVEANMLYIAVYPGRNGNSLNEVFFQRQKNRLGDLVPDEAVWADVVRVIDVPATPEGRTVYINVNCLTQKAVCYLAAPLSA
jgi:pyruvate,water dikinase